MFNKKYIPAKIFVCVIFLCMFGAFGALAFRKTEKALRVGEFEDYVQVEIDWAKLYPFTENKVVEFKTRLKKSKLEQVYENITKKAEEYTSDRLPAYMKIVELARKYEDIIKWNMSSIFTYNNLIALEDGYWTGLQKSYDATPIIDSTVALAEFCSERNIEFMYVQTPGKICKYDDKKISGVLDYSNQKADDLLKGLKAAGVKNCDLRELLHNDGMNHHDSFYKTDHHWKLETGFWAARHILKILREDFNWRVDENILNAENFNFETYHNVMLGSQGKKLTLARAKVEDFVFVRPKIETSFALNIPENGISSSGDFMILRNSKNLIGNLKNGEILNYYADAFRDGTVMHITNNMAKNNKKILVLRASYSNCLLPYVAMGIKYVDAIGNGGGFVGSIQTYIEQTKPDMVMVIYNPSYIESERGAFDFR